MLEKSPARGPRIDKLRVIHLLEADCNCVLKLIWGKRLFQRAHENHLISSAQHARPGHMAQSAVLSKVLSYDLIRLCKKVAASMDNDAAGCYDKIVPPHGMLCCRRLGLPALAAKMLATILNNTIFYLRTGHGVSARTYCSDSVRRIIGTGQGSGAFPYIWAAIFDTILWSIAQKHTGYKMKSPSGKKVSELGDVYVDDTALMHVAQIDTDMKQEGREEVIIQKNKMAQDFEKNLFSTGGELALHKCYWSLIDWRWEEDGTAIMATMKDSPGSMILTKGGGTKKVQIERLECNDAMCTIGGSYLPIRPAGDGI